MHALVMEYIEGPAIDDKEKILADGYDMVEIDVMEVKMDLMEVMKEMLERHGNGLSDSRLIRGAYDAGKTCGNRTLGDSCF